MIYVQNKNAPSRVLFSFDDVITPELNRITWAVAYATRSGCENLVEYISRKIGAAVWDSAIKEFIISIDFGHTEPQALEYLMNTDNSRVLVANGYLLDQGNLYPRAAFHPKVYCFEYQRDTRIISGSANLTKSALHRNTEVVQSQILHHPNFSIDEFTADLSIDTVALTNDFLNNYRNIRQLRPDIVIPERPAINVEEVIEHDVYPWLWDEIENGFNPYDYSYFWIQAGSMSSGGSRNQLELARGSNFFFGFKYDDFINKGPALEIGSINITINGSLHDDRIYRWHSNNMMERLNLPTIVQGGENYQNQCIIFCRRESYFESLVVDWNSEEALDWRNASAEMNKSFRVSQRVRRNIEPRICGFL